MTKLENQPEPSRERPFNFVRLMSIFVKITDEINHSTNLKDGMVKVIMPETIENSEIWPTRCGADYVANLAKPQNWAVAAAACQLRAGYDIGEGGRAIVDNMPVSGARIGAEGGVAVSEGD